MTKKRTRAVRRAAAVLCATDLTAAGEVALDQAGTIARQRKARLIALHVLPDPMRQHPLMPLARKDRYAALPELHARAAAELGKQVARATGRPAGEVELVVEHGVPHAVVIEQAEAFRADLIVVGAAGAGTTRIGHEAERVVRYAHGPVLVARQGPETGVVLCATDLSDAALPAVAAAVEHARQRKSPLVLLHVVDLRPLMVQPDYASVVSVPMPEEVRDSMLVSARGRLQKALGRFRAKGELVVETGDPASVILNEAARLKAALLVVGTSGATGLARMVLGSVAESVVHRAPCSTLAVRLHQKKTR